MVVRFAAMSHNTLFAIVFPFAAALFFFLIVRPLARITERCGKACWRKALKLAGRR